MESASSSSTPQQRPSGAWPSGPAPSPPPRHQHQASGGAPQATARRSPARRLLDGFLGMPLSRGGQSNDSAPPRPVASGKDSSAPASGGAGLAPTSRRPPLLPAAPGMAAQLNPAEADRLRGFIDGAEVSVLVSSGATTRIHCTHATRKAMCLLQRYSRCCITKLLVGMRLAGRACSTDCSAVVRSNCQHTAPISCTPCAQDTLHQMAVLSLVLSTHACSNRSCLELRRRRRARCSWRRRRQGLRQPQRRPRRWRWAPRQRRSPLPRGRQRLRQRLVARRRSWPDCRCAG